MHNCSWSPHGPTSEDEIRWNTFLREQGIPYLVRLCTGLGIKADITEAGTMGVPRANVQCMAYNVFSTYYSRNRLSTHQELLDFSFALLGERITLN